MYQEDFETQIHLSMKDITFISHSHSYDEEESLKSCTDLEKMTKRIQDIQDLNSQLASQIQFIKENPDTVELDALGEELYEKIELLKKQNAQLKTLIQRNRDETPMKRDSMRDSFKDSMRQSLNTPRKHKKELSKQTIQKSNRMLRISSNSILDQIDNNFYLEKAEVSTCQNYQMTYSKRENEEREEDSEIEKLRPLNEKENRIKNGLKVRAEIDAAKESLVGNRLKSMTNEEKCEREEGKEGIPAEEVERMHQHKLRLIKKLKSTTLKEEELKKIISELDRLYSGSIERYKQLQQILQEHLTSRETVENEEADIIQRYHEALRLQQVLNVLNKQYDALKKSNQDSSQQQLSRLKTIKRELVTILNKLRLKCNIQGLGIAESIQMMSIQILNNVYIPNSRSMSNIQSKVLRIRELCEQEKEANAKIISQLKTKEQVLGKELLEKQMSKSKK